MSKYFYAVDAPAVIFNRAGTFSFPDDGWCHLVPKGEFPHPQTGVVQIFDDAGLSAMVKNFKSEAEKPNFPGVRGDFDHFSYDDDKATEASCWLQDVQVRDNGLWGKLKLTNKGREAVEGGEYRLLSPTFRPAECDILNNREIQNSEGKTETKPLKVRPLRLDSIAFCNNPNLRGMVPLSNRETPSESSEAKPKAKKMKSVCEALGLSPDADEASVLAEVKKHMAKSGKVDQIQMAHDALKNRIEEIEPKLKTMEVAQVESDLAVYANRIPKGWEGKVKDMLLSNRGTTVDWLKTQPEIKSEKPIHNRNADTSAIAARNSGAVGEEKTDDQKKVETARAKTIKNRADQLFNDARKNRNGTQYDTCWRQAEAGLISKS